MRGFGFLMSVKVALVLAALLMLTAGCGQRGAEQDNPYAPGAATFVTTEADVGFDQPPIDWDNPLGGAKVANIGTSSVQLADQQETTVELPFQVQLPEKLGTPVAAYVADIDADLPLDFKKLELIYDSPEYGRLIVIEHHPSLPNEKEYAAYEQEMASISGTPLAHGSADIVELDNGIEALYETSGDDTSTSINWYVSAGTGDYEVIVLAPKITLEQARAVANTF
jgi:hypothetical protein